MSEQPPDPWRAPAGQPSPPPAPPPPPPAWGPPGPPPGPPRRRVSPAVIIAIVVAVVVVVVFLATQGGDDEPTGDEQAYIDAVATRLEQDDDFELLSYDESQCMAEGFVEALGVETFQAAGTPDEIVQATEIPMTMDDGQAATFFDVTDSCVDFRELFLSVLRSQRVPQEAIDCVDDRVDDEVLREAMLAAFTGDSAAGQAAFDEAAGVCEGLEG
jgi:hypothetical protein